jgi:hypothetical protein
LQEEKKEDEEEKGRRKIRKGFGTEVDIKDRDSDWNQKRG